MKKSIAALLTALVVTSLVSFATVGVAQQNKPDPWQPVRFLWIQPEPVTSPS
jgi:hypothetical protein